MTEGSGRQPGAGPAELRIEDVPAANRYEARLGDTLAGWVDYRRMHSRLVAIHTEVLPQFGGKGIGSALVRRVIVDAREAGAFTPVFASVSWVMVWARAGPGRSART